MIEQHMLESPAHDLPIRFRRDLQYKAGNRCFHLRSRNMEHRVLDDIAPISVGPLIADGNCTPGVLKKRSPRMRYPRGQRSLPGTGVTSRNAPVAYLRGSRKHRRSSCDCVPERRLQRPF